MYPKLNIAPEAQPFVTAFHERNPKFWAQLHPTRKLVDAWDAHMRLGADPEALQAEMDSLTSE
jgi:hypothetical protein